MSYWLWIREFSGCNIIVSKCKEMSWILARGTLNFFVQHLILIAEVILDPQNWNSIANHIFEISKDWVFLWYKISCFIKHLLISLYDESRWKFEQSFSFFNFGNVFLSFKCITLVNVFHQRKIFGFLKILLSHCSATLRI